MYIKLTNYHYNGSVYTHNMPQFKIRISNLSQNKEKISPQKYQNEKLRQYQINKVTNYEKLKKINLSVDMRNQNNIFKPFILYKCDFNQDTYIWNQKQEKVNKRIIPQQMKIEEKKSLHKDILIDQQNKKFSEKLNYSCRSKETTQLKQYSQSKTKSKDLNIEPKGWTNISSHSLL